MDFVAIMHFTQQVFHLQCLLCQIKSQPGGGAYKSVDYKKHLTLFFIILKMEK